jgi:hypothetical protein
VPPFAQDVVVLIQLKETPYLLVSANLLHGMMGQYAEVNFSYIKLFNYLKI